MNVYGVIMAGGGGTRFWPLSRQKKPKQFLNLSGKELMVNEAIDRLSTIADKSDMFLVINESQISAMVEAVEGRIPSDHVLAEPCARNTAACIGYAAIEIMKKYGDGVMVITPSDHYIKNLSGLTRILHSAVKLAETEDKLVTIGITPTFPSTGFGYIQYQTDVHKEEKLVKEFKEKPDEQIAKGYISKGNYVWNSGMFVWKASAILEKFKQLVPDIYENLVKIGDAMGTKEESKVIREVYPNIRKISVDYAIMEPSAINGDVLVLLGDFGWNDVGSWDQMEVLHDVDEAGNVKIGDIVTLDTKNSVVYSSSKLVAIVGVEDVVIVDTPDVVMVCSKNKAQDVKSIVDELSKMGRTELL